MAINSKQKGAAGEREWAKFCLHSPIGIMMAANLQKIRRISRDG